MEFIAVQLLKELVGTYEPVVGSKYINLNHGKELCTHLQGPQQLSQHSLIPTNQFRILIFGQHSRHRLRWRYIKILHTLFKANEYQSLQGAEIHHYLNEKYKD